VVDAETLQPIQGAVVFVEWTYIPAGAIADSFYDAAEVLTDERGHFHIGTKRSWNPWLNSRLEANVVIYKAGYREFDTLNWGRMDELVEESRVYSLKKEQRVPADVPWKLEYEDGNVLVLLKELTTLDEMVKNYPRVNRNTPEEKMKLLRGEEARQRKAAGRKD
jgi:hypothetical protein